MSAAKAFGGLVVIGLLTGGLYAGDRYAEGQAEEYGRGVVAESLMTTAQPVVDIHGFPFLTQLLGGTLDNVTATAPGANLQGIAVTDVAVEAHGVLIRPPAGQQPSAGRATVAATIPTASIEKILRDRTGLTVQLAVKGSGLEASGNALGLPIVITLAPRVDAGKLLVDVRGLSLGGRAIGLQSLPSALRDRLSGIEVPVQGLPKGLGLTQATVVPTGVRITAAGNNVVVPEAGNTG